MYVDSTDTTQYVVKAIFFTAFDHENSGLQRIPLGKFVLNLKIMPCRLMLGSQMICTPCISFENFDHNVGSTSALVQLFEKYESLSKLHVPLTL